MTVEKRIARNDPQLTALHSPHPQLSSLTDLTMVTITPSVESGARVKPLCEVLQSGHSLSQSDHVRSTLNPRRYQCRHVTLTTPSG